MDPEDNNGDLGFTLHRVMPLAWGMKAEVVQGSELAGKQKCCRDVNLTLLRRFQQPP